MGNHLDYLAAPDHTGKLVINVVGVKEWKA